jgi:hypothetical protein
LGSFSEGIEEVTQDHYDPDSELRNTFIEREKRSSNRKNTCSEFVLTIDGAQIEGAGSNISQTGAYMVTCDEIPVELVIRGKHEERTVSARIVRIDKISEGSRGVALRFETRLKDIESFR